MTSQRRSECGIRPRILLAAIAKDEAAYLPEWIFYHLRLGVDQILIYVNGTQDNTTQILDRIKSKHPVEYRIADGMDKVENPSVDKLVDPLFLKRNPLQSRCYADIFLNNRNNFNGVLFLDIDEFIMPLESELKALLLPDSYNAIQYFNWFNLTGDEQEFCLLNQCQFGSHSTTTKYLIGTDVEDLNLRTSHTASASSCDSTLNRNCCILHRKFRSRREYVSMVGRGNPSENAANGFKTNRKGWQRGGKKKPIASHDMFATYEDDFNSFIDQCDCRSELVTARSLVLKRIERVVEEVERIRTLSFQVHEVLLGSGISPYPSFRSPYRKLSTYIKDVLLPANVRDSVVYLQNRFF